VGIRRDCEPLQALLSSEARAADWLILWLDCDREGEAICQEARGGAAASAASLARSVPSRLCFRKRLALARRAAL
jgi:DNA topoisomerase IA